MKENSTCPNCKSELDTEIIINGRLTTLELFTEGQNKLINYFAENKNNSYCSNCGYSLLLDSKKRLEIEIKKIKEYIFKRIKYIPIITAHSPLNWDYDILGIVTGQSTIGTGALTEIVSSFTDLFGMQSELHNEKLKKGEENSFTQVRLQTLKLGGNAVIATDIDYSEIGSLKGMLMVCVSGTAVNLYNLSELKNNKLKILENISNYNKKLQELEELNMVN